MKQEQTFAEVISGADARKLATAAGVSAQAVYKWRSGALPGNDLIPAIGKIIGWPTSKLQALVNNESAARRKARS